MYLGGREARVERPARAELECQAAARAVDGVREEGADARVADLRETGGRMRDEYSDAR